MGSSPRFRRVFRTFVIGWAIVLMGALGPSAPAWGAVTQPDGVLVVPIDGALSSDLACCNNTLANMSLDALFKSRGEPIDYRNDAVTVAAMVAKGAADAAVLLRAVTVAQIDTVAEAGLRMPQKTTFFQPKPLTGLVFRSLDSG